MKPCKQVKAFGTCIFGRVLPLYSLFGNVSGITYYYDTKGLHVYNNNTLHWFLAKVPQKRYNEIFTYINAFCVSPEYINKPTVECRRDGRAIASLVPREKKHPQPMYGKTSGCYSQARVDGRGYNLDWEEKVLPVHGDGLPVYYEKGHTKPIAAFTSFEGYTDTPEAKRRDGLKVDPKKVRPEKAEQKKKITYKVVTETGKLRTSGVI